jgi:hypothetical protein
VRSVVCTDTSQPFERVSGGADMAIGMSFLYAEIKDIQGQLLSRVKSWSNIDSVVRMRIVPSSSPLLDSFDIYLYVADDRVIDEIKLIARLSLFR